MANPSQDDRIGKNRLLAAASRLEALDDVALYAIMLAKRTGLDVLLVMIFTAGRGVPPAGGEATVREKFSLILQAAAAEGVRIECITAAGGFIEEVVKHLTALDSPLLVVGEGENKKVRQEELRRIEKMMAQIGIWPRNRAHHFLIVTKKGKELAKGGSQGGASVLSAAGLHTCHTTLA